MTQSIVKCFAIVSASGLFMGGTPIHPTFGAIERASLYPKYIGAKAALRILRKDCVAGVSIQELTVKYVCNAVEGGAPSVADAAGILQSKLGTALARLAPALSEIERLKADLALAQARANTAERKLAAIGAPTMAGEGRFELLEIN